MRIVFGTFLFLLAVLIDSIELSSQSINIPPRHPARFPNIEYYEAINGTLIPIGREVALRRRGNFFYGVLVDGQIYPMCDGDGQRVIVNTTTLENIPMTPESALAFGFHNLHWNLNINQRRFFAIVNRRNSAL